MKERSENYIYIPLEALVHLGDLIITKESSNKGQKKSVGPSILERLNLWTEGRRVCSGPLEMTHSSQTTLKFG